ESVSDRNPGCGVWLALHKSVDVRQRFLGLVGSKQVVNGLPQLHRSSWFFRKELRAWRLRTGRSTHSCRNRQDHRERDRHRRNSNQAETTDSTAVTLYSHVDTVHDFRLMSPIDDRSW